MKAFWSLKGIKMFIFSSFGSSFYFQGFQLSYTF